MSVRLHRAKKFARRIAVRDEGAIAILSGLSLPLIMLSVGIAVDVSRWYDAQSAMSAALDSAVLAGARSLQLSPDKPDQAIATAQKTYVANKPSHFTLLNESITFVTADSNQSITASGSAYIATTFLSIAGFRQLQIAGAPGAGLPKATIGTGGLGGSNLELAIMLDVTGSMCDDGIGPCTSSTKMDGLRAATKKLVDAAILADQSKFTSKAAIIPFSTRVRIAPDGQGASEMKYMTNLDATWSGWYNTCVQYTGNFGSETYGDRVCQKYEAQYKTGWKILPCVTDRFYISANAPDYTDDPPGRAKWINGQGGDRGPYYADSTDVPLTKLTGTTQADPTMTWNYSADGKCIDVGNGNQILPLTSDKTALKNRVDALQAYGSTSGALGTAFAWYTLSPNWKGLFTGQSAPGSYNDVTTRRANGSPLLRKVAVLMTDGGYNTMRGWKDVWTQADVSTHAKNICANMKAKGIEIYTVGFALNELSKAEQSMATQTLQACGTDIKHFYDTQTVQQLQSAFQDIALRVGTIYLSK